MLQYKANLDLLSSRYGDFERRVLALFADQPGAGFIDLDGGGMDLQLMYLIRDGLLVETQYFGPQISFGARPLMRRFALTETGRELVGRWKRAEKLEG